jgi:hypothetical protein
MKQCSICGEYKDEKEFNFRNQARNLRWGICKVCQAGQRKIWYENNKEKHIKKVRVNRLQAVAEGQAYIWAYLSKHPCVDCGETNPIVLEFDHVRGKKIKAVGDFARAGYSIETIAAEIAKCEVRCANCHRIKTHRERGWFRG